MKAYKRIFISNRKHPRSQYERFERTPVLSTFCKLFIYFKSTDFVELSCKRRSLLLSVFGGISLSVRPKIQQKWFCLPFGCLEILWILRNDVSLLSPEKDA